MLERRIEFFGTERRFSEMGAADMESCNLHRRKTVSGSTVNRELALLRRLFSLANTGISGRARTRE
jgi:hypothetical protein